jgi:hypothetical protein
MITQVLTGITIIPLTSEQSYDYGLSSGSKGTGATRNLLFLDTAHNTAKWLLDKQVSMIEQYDFLSMDNGMPSTTPSTPALGILYTIVGVDSNQDARLSGNDRKTLAISQTDGTGFKILVQNAETMIGQKMVDRNTLLLVFTQNGVAKTLTVDLATGAIRNNVDLPAVPTTP